MKRFALLGLALGALLAGGCLHPPITDASRQGPFFAPKNFVGDPKLPGTMRRVVLLPVHGGDFAPPEAVEALDPVFATALEKQMRFEVVTLGRDECQASFGRPDIASTAALPHDFLQDLARKFGAQGVLFVDLTAYQPFRPLTLGIRAKLASVPDRRLVWSFDEVFSASDPAVENSVRHFYLNAGTGPMPLDMTSSALQSPTRFGAYVAETTFRTLPAR
ncbi:MAG TPA: hypothetical protein VHC86_00305 [Opitutaceae bacterium]|nr:hypothetical protein [Opitutaceae bacterium]